MIVINNYNGPSSEEVEKIYKLFPIINELNLSISSNVNNDNPFVSFLSSNELYSWIVRLNNKFGKIRLSYIFLKSYKLKGIPDDKWFDTSGKNRKSVEYFPDFKDEHFINKYFYEYYYEFLYYHFFSAIDIILHIINIKLSINIKIYDNKFTNLILDYLKKENNNLYSKFKEFKNNKSIKIATKIRNDLTHNFAPYEIDSGVQWSGVSGKSSTKIGIGNYKTSSEILSNIEEIITLLVNILNEIVKLIN